MIRLFNLESYVECCHHARLFHQSPEQLIPTHGELSRAYKALLQEYATHPYLLEAILGKTRPQELAINPSSLDCLLIGTELNRGDKQRLFIIRDTVDLITLGMSNLLEHQDGYLYSSAYHYWNHYSEISQYNVTKPLVFVDLDSFGCDRLIPINFACAENDHYKVPLLNTKVRIDIKSDYKFTETYNSICQSLARLILDEQFPAIAKNTDTVTHLASYLQKTSFFQNIQQYIERDSFDVLIEILHHNQIYYKQVTLSTVTIAEIVSRGINAQHLNHLASTHPEYQFALIAHYNIFPNIQRLLPKFICLNPTFQEFNKIWQEKSQLKFPLFGIYLDSIEFAVGMLDETGRSSKQWIQLSNQEDAISYEGKPTVLIGRIPSNKKDFFRISAGITAKLPIKVNGKDYCKNGVPQDYSIEIDNPSRVEDICIRIEFHLQPGSFPKLKVTDLEGKYKIIAYLTDRKTLSYSHIPVETINNTREQESLSQINRLKERKELEHFRGYLLQLAGELDKFGNTSNKVVYYTNLKKLLNNAWQQIHRKNNSNFDLLQFINASSNEPVVSRLRTELQNQSFQKLADIISDFINISNCSVLTLAQEDLLVDAIMFIGKTYKLSQYLFPNSLFSQTQVSRSSQIRHRSLGNEYLPCLARVAVKEELQRQYFSWFNSYYKLETTQYLWGYGRILLWYYNFDSVVKLLNHREHFTTLLDYLFSKSHSDFNAQYK